MGYGVMMESTEPVPRGGPAILLARLDAASARAIVTWRYPPPDDRYSLHDARDAANRMLEPELRFYALRQADALIGFCSFGKDGQVPGGDHADGALDIGLGLRPELTGRGLSRDAIAAILDFAAAAWAPATFCVTIAVCNPRAQRAWERFSFREVSRFRVTSGDEFAILTRGGLHGHP